ncbi:MAG: hypothetical protein Fur0041_05590 [Bacteroidia bacterium]
MKHVLFISLFLTLSCSHLFSQTGVLHANPEDVDLYIPEENALTDTSVLRLNSPNSALACPSGATINTGYPAWTNYYAGYMININNISTMNMTIDCFEARFQGTSGYRIYTKTGTFVGSETNPAAWTLVGNIAAGVVGVSTTGPSPIPIAVNVIIPPGATQAFYLTRTDNVTTNRHLYVTGTGTPGTTVYCSNADLQITEARYLDPYFTLQAGSRRPSLTVYYTLSTPMPVELIEFNCSSQNDNISLNWSTATEENNHYFLLERSTDANSAFLPIAEIPGNGNSSIQHNYSYTDYNPVTGNNYYRLKQIDYNGHEHILPTTQCQSASVTASNIIIRSITGQFIFSGLSSDYRATLNSIKPPIGIYLIQYPDLPAKGVLKEFYQVQ